MRDVLFHHDMPAGEYALRRIFSNADFEPLSTTAAALAIAGGATSAAGTLMGGNSAAAMGRAQQQEANVQAVQDTMNSAAAVAGAQRKALDTSMRANLMQSTAVASAAAGGVETTTGSPLATQSQIVARGRYSADLDLWNGQNEATGDLNKAAAAQYSGQIAAMGGQMAQEGSEFSAVGTLMSSGASAYKIYGMGNNPAGASSGVSLPAIY
jgi:hypothetical protein